MNENELLKLKQEIDEAKSKISELKGTKNHLMKDLKENWDCDALKGAEAKHKALRVELTTISSKIEKGVKELNEKYEL